MSIVDTLLAVGGALALMYVLTEGALFQPATEPMTAALGFLGVITVTVLTHLAFQDTTVGEEL